MKVFCIILSLLFLLFAVVQFNDPDPWLWVSWYAFISVLLAMAAFKRFSNTAIWFGIGFSSAILTSLAPDFFQWINDGMPSVVNSMKAESPYIELVRETLGMLLSLMSCVGLWLHHRFRRRAIASVTS